MDESRARALLRAERAEVATLLRETEAAVSIDEQAPDSATDYGDASLPLTEGANDEAVAVQPSAEVPDRTIVSVERSGFALGDRVIRPAQVVVARTPEHVH